MARYEKLTAWQENLKDLFIWWLSEPLDEGAVRLAIEARDPEMQDWVMRTFEEGLRRLAEGDREALRIVRKRFGRQVRSAGDARDALEEARDLYLAAREEALKLPELRP